MRMRWLLVGLGVAAAVGAPLAGAAKRHKSSPKSPTALSAGDRTPSHGFLRSPTVLITKTSTYGLRVTNAATTGGSGSFQCASALTAEPCLKSSNGNGGEAFAFQWAGVLGGVFQVGADINKQFPGAAPFITNATGVAIGLNADRVDGMHAQDIINTAVDRASVQVGATGPQGPQGAQGQRGAQGIQGPAGPPGTPLAAAKATPANATYASAKVVDVPTGAIDDDPPAADTDGADLLPTQTITLTPGTYVVQTTLHGFNFDKEDPTATQYGVAELFLDGQPQATLWTGSIPADGANAAQAADTTVITVASGAAGVLKLRGADHSDALSPAAPSTAELGAGVVVTAVNATS